MWSENPICVQKEVCQVLGRLRAGDSLALGKSKCPQAEVDADTLRTPQAHHPLCPAGAGRGSIICCGRCPLASSSWLRWPRWQLCPQCASPSLTTRASMRCFLGGEEEFG